MKRYVLFAGANGAGKTTLYQTFPHLWEMPRINLDEIVREAGSWQNPEDVLNAGKKAVCLVNEYFEKNRIRVSVYGHSSLSGLGCPFLFAKNIRLISRKIFAFQFASW